MFTFKGGCKLILWDELPVEMKNESVRKYYDLLSQKRVSLIMKRLVDLLLSLFLLVVLSPVMVIIAVCIKCSSKGPVLFKQTRVTKYYRRFKIYKFRTMVVDAEKIGTQVTTENDSRVTKIGKFLRKFRLDELPQLLNILKGDMAFVGTRPEVPRYVQQYSEQMYATLLMPAGLTSLASINFKDEDKLLKNKENTDEVYIKKILPKKMEYNLEYIENFNFWYDWKLMFNTVLAVLK